MYNIKKKYRYRTEIIITITRSNGNGVRVFSYNNNWIIPFKYTFNNINDYRYVTVIRVLYLCGCKNSNRQQRFYCNYYH
jgi:hypothetical protein